MENNIEYKRLYELSIIEKEKLLMDNKLKNDNIAELLEEIRLAKENSSKKNYYQKNKEKIIEKVKEYKKNYEIPAEKIKEYNKRAYERRKKTHTRNTIYDVFFKTMGNFISRFCLDVEWIFIFICTRWRTWFLVPLCECFSTII